MFNFFIFPVFWQKWKNEKMTSLSLLLHYSILKFLYYGLENIQGKKRLLASIDFSFFHCFEIKSERRESDLDVIPLQYASKGIFDGLLFPPGLERDVSHGCASFEAMCSLDRRKRTRRR